jgi:hypothetical protein
MWTGMTAFAAFALAPWTATLATNTFALAVATLATPVTTLAIAAIAALATVATVTTGTTAAAFVTVASGALLDHRLEVAGRQQLEDALTVVLLLRLDDRQDPNPVDVLFGLDLQLIADRGTLGQDRSIERAPGLTRPGSAPGPRPVSARARELDFDPGRHGSQL